MSDFKDMAIKLFGKTIQLEPEEHEQKRDPSAEVTDDKNDTTTCSGIESSKKEDESSSTLQDKALKKPDKILPCPRCNSSETKFCYYNNYNVNQPRHFCKKCQRYWTAGGSMRNVPVGAGRRKNKTSSASRYHQFIVSEAIKAVGVNAANGIRNLGRGSNSTVLCFGLDCESVESMLTLREKKSRLHRLDRCSDNGSNCKPVPPCLSCFGGAITPYKINSETPSITLPAPFYPLSYWSRNVPSTRPVAIQPRPIPSSIPPSPLGKHSREGKIISPANTEASSTDKSTSLVPKTLTIDDPSEAVNSSIWTTLNINSQNSISVNEGRLFNGFRTKMEDKNYIAEASAVLQANPAALMRSINFHERSI